MSEARKKLMHKAAKAHTNLTMFSAIQGLAEGGCIYGSNAAARRIVSICRAEQQRQLRAYDAAVAALESHP